MRIIECFTRSQDYNRVSTWVPDHHLYQSQELSTNAKPGAGGYSIHWPSKVEGTRHLFLFPDDS